MPLLILYENRRSSSGLSPHIRSPCPYVDFTRQYKLISMPSTVAPGTKLVQLIAEDNDGRPHTRTTFHSLVPETLSPFRILQDPNAKARGLVVAHQTLKANRVYRLKVRALSFGAQGSLEKQVTFVIILSVGPYPY